MTQIHRNALLPYSANMLFDLVNDIASYPEFMDGCSEAQILASEADCVTAKLVLQKSGIRQSFSTQNQLYKPNKIVLKLAEGPFESLHGEWNFVALADNACKVSLDLNFKMKNAVTHKASAKLFEKVATNLVSCLCARAKSIYG